MGHVFISYAREDRERVSALASALESAGISVWLDDRLVAGSHFDTAIEEALAQARAVVVAWSPASVASRWVRAEAGDGLDRGILVPVKIEPTQTPLEFRRVQTVDLSDWSGEPTHEEFVKLMAALKPELAAKPRSAKKPGPPVASTAAKPAADGLTAELVQASRLFGTLKIIVRSGNDSVVIHHKTRAGLGQEVFVDGESVSKGSYGSFQEYHRFPLQLGGSEHIAELILYGRLAFGIHRFRLRVDGQDLLNETLAWKGDVAVFIGITVLGLGFMTLVEPWKVMGERTFDILYWGGLVLIILGGWIAHRRSRRS